MRELKIRCSAIGRLMTEPKTKAEGPLSVGAKTAIREIAMQDILGVQFEISDRKLQKGIEVEGEAIALLNRVRGLDLVKNAERRTDEYLTGEADLFDVVRRRGHDLKSAWSAQTFPGCVEDVAAAQRVLYEWQMRGYMRLWDADEWEINYALVNTPEHLIGYEPPTLHYVDHIAEAHRITTWTVKRDAEKEAAIVEKVKHARIYYAEFCAEFDRTHGGQQAGPSPAPIAAPAPIPDLIEF